jgi:hypothetical protein
MFFHHFFNNIQSQPAELLAFFVVKNRSNIRGKVFGEISLPLSVTAKSRIGFFFIYHPYCSNSAIVHCLNHIVNPICPELIYCVWIAQQFSESVLIISGKSYSVF